MDLVDEKKLLFPLKIGETFLFINRLFLAAGGNILFVNCCVDGNHFHVH